MKSSESQFAFNFDTPTATATATATDVLTVPAAVLVAAQDYQLQMQSYALAVRELLPSLAGARIRVTLHFLDPNLEFQLNDELLEAAVCERAIDAAMLQIISSSQPAEFPVLTALHCRMCNFLRVCNSGRDWVRQNHPQITQI